MTTEIIPFEQEIAAMQPLGLPDGYRVSLHYREVGRMDYIDIHLWRSADGSQSVISRGNISYSKDSTVSLEARIKSIRAEAVRVFNGYVTTLSGADILKSIEDRLNEPSGMLVLTPGHGEDDMTYEGGAW